MMKIASAPSSQTAMPGTKAPRTSTSANIRGLPQQQRRPAEARPQQFAPGERDGQRLGFPLVARAAGERERATAQRTRVPGGLDHAPPGRVKKTRRRIGEQA